MREVLDRIVSLWDFSPQGLITLVDLALVTYLVFRLLKLIRGTRAWRVVLGIGVFVLALFASEFFQLRTLHWVLEKATLLGPVALAILFLPELRQAIEGFGRLGLWSERLLGTEVTVGANTLEELVGAVTAMSEQRIGSLVVVERGTALDDVAANGVPVNGLLTAPLLQSIFHPGNPLHDGAVLVRRSQITAAACRLPLSESRALNANVHMRHRAGVGITEQADCLSVIVSEERGQVSVALEGVLYPISSAQDLRAMLSRELRGLGTRKPRLAVADRMPRRRADSKKVRFGP